METSALVPLLLLLCAAAVASSSAARQSSAAEAEQEAAVALPVLEAPVNDLLPKYGLPPGLLPATVKSYSLDDKGKFVLKLAAPCYVMFTELVYYDRTITGKLSYGAITDLSGIQVKKLFVWVSVTGMVAKSDGKAIEFQVGFLSETLPSSLFAKIPSCRKSASPCHDEAGTDAAAAAAVEAA